eukprot:scaffold772_cov339-Pavlova_lutheri.AAC.52
MHSKEPHPLPPNPSIRRGTGPISETSISSRFDRNLSGRDLDPSGHGVDTPGFPSDRKGIRSVSKGLEPGHRPGWIGAGRSLDDWRDDGDVSDGDGAAAKAVHVRSTREDGPFAGPKRACKGYVRHGMAPGRRRTDGRGGSTSRRSDRRHLGGDARRHRVHLPAQTRRGSVRKDAGTRQKGVWAPSTSQ